VGARGWWEAQSNANVMVAAPNITGGEHNLKPLNSISGAGLSEAIIKTTGIEKHLGGLTGVDTGKTIDKSPLKGK
jgi:hypothetical protein